eukprot:gene22939-6985_t
MAPTVQRGGAAALRALATAARLVWASMLPIPFDARYVLRWALYPAFRSGRSRVPGPGIVGELCAPVLLRLWWNWARLYDWLLGLVLEHGRTLCLQPNFLRVVDRFGNYSKRSSALAVTKDLLGDGIFIADHDPHCDDGGRSWFRQRKIAARVFTMHNFRGFMERTFARHAQHLLAIVGQHARTGEEFDVQELFFRLTLDSIGVLGFGVELGTLQQRDVPFVKAFDD